MPSQPLAIIETTKGLASLNLVELWTYRELLYFLTWRDVKSARYKQTALGAAWAILQPVFMMIVFSLFFGRLAGVESKASPYALFALAGLVPWTFCQRRNKQRQQPRGKRQSDCQSFTFHARWYPPRPWPPDWLISSLHFLRWWFAMLYYKVGLTLNLLMLPVLVVLTTLFALAVGMWMSALNVKYRDVRFALPFVIQIWLFVSSGYCPVNGAAAKVALAALPQSDVGDRGVVSGPLYSDKPFLAGAWHCNRNHSGGVGIFSLLI